ncbi:MAG: DUF3048 domain-containing protein [Coriobacteriia bacterium]|nr:DUF3048 domain-containing protein [Coriobacteriia bacterium]
MSLFANKKLIVISGAIALVVIIGAGVLVYAASHTNTYRPLATGPASMETAALPSIDAKPPEEPVAPVYPLTGLPAPDMASRLVRPLSVKIENVPEVRPQLGISSADVVYETATEGGITRFNCIYQSTIPDEVGPIRSARNSDVSLVPQYDALFFISGANKVVLSEIAAAGLADMSYTRVPGIYHRVSFAEAPHNLYLYLDEVYAVAESIGLETTVDTVPELEFLAEFPQHTPDAQTITVPFSDYYVAQWSWSADDQVYYRSMDSNTTDVDGTPVVASNVVVLWIPYVPLPHVLEGQTFAIDMAGSGDASLFIAGKRYDGTWESDGVSPPRFKDAEGNSILLAPGKTWFQVLDIGQTIQVS